MRRRAVGVAAVTAGSQTELPTLALAVAQADRQAVLADLFRDYGATVWRWATRLGCSRSDAQDVLQEVFLTANRRLRRIPPVAAEVDGWLFGITRRVVYEQRRRERRQAELAQAEGEVSALSEPLGFAERRLEQRQVLRTLYDLLDTLREVERTAVVLHDLEGLSGREAAELMRLPVPAFWNHLLRGRRRLQRRWEAQRTQDAAGAGETGE